MRNCMLWISKLPIVLRSCLISSLFLLEQLPVIQGVCVGAIFRFVLFVVGLFCWVWLFLASYLVRVCELFAVSFPLVWFVVVNSAPYFCIIYVKIWIIYVGALFSGADTRLKLICETCDPRSVVALLTDSREI